jgi:hypothetical protein
MHSDRSYGSAAWVQWFKNTVAALQARSDVAC